MLFQNYEVMPLGSAQLNINEQGHLIVSNIGNSGLDGLLVINNDNNSIDVYHQPIVLNNESVVRVSFLGKNSLNQVATYFEEITWIDTSNQRVQFGFNMGLLPKYFNIFGKLNDNPVFDIPKLNPKYQEPPPEAQTIWAAIGAIAALVTAAVAVYNALTTKEKTETKITIRNDGSWEVTVTKIKDPTPFEIDVDNQTYVVDEWGVKFTEVIPSNETVKVLRPVGVQITGYSIDTIEIISISP
ncbi:hypothetical protein D9V84_02875 [Bacteroidetes/Chlorobi group bacterium Naka2016]|jgi:hypothetical protein|nr:MAG: hypothetical protein D9V84_02875 [Bacteroidetes/Chlorobi group bacterium Naka2016]